MEDILLILSVAVVMTVVWLSLGRLGRLLREGKLARRLSRTERYGFYDRRVEERPKQKDGLCKDDTHGLSGRFLLR